MSAKLAVCAVIQHPMDHSLMLSVSRKDDPNKIGLPGGKMLVRHYQVRRKTPCL